MPSTLLVATAAALAILLIAVGIATSGRGSAITARLDRYASGRQEQVKPASTGQGPISDLLAQSAAMAQLNKIVEERDFGATLSRELARADLKLKVSEYLFIWAGTIVLVPVILFIFGFFSPILGNPI
ncbi:MAG: hypothetical protein ACHQ01_09275, partial [Candidatus Limnocylindrales bacterium]